jgi:hypothetical protein
MAFYQAVLVLLILFSAAFALIERRLSIQSLSNGPTTPSAINVSPDRGEGGLDRVHPIESGYNELNKFKLNYLAVFGLVMVSSPSKRHPQFSAYSAYHLTVQASDWLQGPYLFSLCSFRYSISSSLLSFQAHPCRGSSDNGAS